MKYITLFENHAQYAAAESGLILPNVSLCVNEDEVHYKPFDPYNGHDYVEIGNLKWATMNIGATATTDTGLYFQWGDTQGYTASQVGSGEGQKYFGWADYKYGNGTSNPGREDMTKYNATDGKTVLDASDDAASVNWGGSWRMPTADDFRTLTGATNKQWTSNYNSTGVKGYVFKDKTTNEVLMFLPVTGEADNGALSNNTSCGYYWSSSLMDSNAIFSTYIWFSNEGYGGTNSSYRQNGFAIRPVIG